MGAGWDEVDPLEYLTPFLETIKSPETSGPITLVALAALDRIIRRGILSAWLLHLWAVGGCILLQTELSC